MLEPLAHRDVMARVPIGVQLHADLADEPVTLGDHSVLVNCLEVTLPRIRERRGRRREVPIG